MTDMPLADALALADHASPMPHLAGQALRRLRREIAELSATSPRTPRDRLLDLRAMEESARIAERIHNVRQALTEQHLADLDEVLYGESFMVDGKRVDPERVQIKICKPADSGRVDLLNGEMLQAGADALERFVAWESSNDEERYACIEAVWRAMRERTPTPALAAQGQVASPAPVALDDVVAEVFEDNPRYAIKQALLAAAPPTPEGDGGAE